MKRIVPIIALMLFFACKQNKPQNEESTEVVAEMEAESPEDATITPIEHATAVLEWNGNTLYIDPVGSKEAFEGQKPPTLILITDIHGDHFNLETLQALDTVNATIVAPKAVADQIPTDFGSPVVVMNNGETKTSQGLPLRPSLCTTFGKKPLTSTPKEGVTDMC